MTKEEILKELGREIDTFIEIIKNLDQSSYEFKQCIPDNLHNQLDRVDKELDTVKEQYIELIKEIKTKVQGLVKQLTELNQDWDTLNIAFFGETNAGKSTLIEALICGDGRTIGDGRKDFTRSVSTYNFSNNKIKLNDMPGIEGDESKVIHEIQKAVKKAHIVFYVHSDGKEPERGTLEKIKKYLKQNASVYGIINIRGYCKPDILKERFEGQKAQTVKTRTEKHFKEILSDAYKGTIQVHALFGFFGKARNIPENLKQNYEKWVDIYGGREVLLKVSNLEELISIINSYTKDFEIYQLEILWNNFYKIFSVQEEIFNRIFKFKKNYDENIKQIQDKIDILREKYRTQKNILKNNINEIINMKVNSLKTEIIEIIISAIDNDLSKDYIENQIKDKVDSFKKSIESDLEKEIKDFLDKIKEDLDIMNRKVNLILSSLKVDPQLDSIFKKMEYTFDEVLKGLFTVVSGIWGAITAYAIHPILGIVSGAVFILKKYMIGLLVIHKRKNLKQNLKL